MSESQNSPASTPAKDLDARIAALEKYLAEPPPLPSPSVEFVGGTVVHVRHVGSFNVPRGVGSWAGVAVAALIIIVVSVLFFRRRSKAHTRAA
jgi:hypothetical protein